MVALRQFLVDRSDFSINDFTLTHWAKFEAAASGWEQPTTGEEPKPFDWGGVLPFVDVWLDVPTHELHYVQKILPTLDWNGTHMGVRLRYEPKDVQMLKQEYLIARAAAVAVMSKAHEPKPLANGPANPILPPQSQQARKEALISHFGRVQ